MVSQQFQNQKDLDRVPHYRLHAFVTGIDMDSRPCQAHEDCMAQTNNQTQAQTHSPVPIQITRPIPAKIQKMMKMTEAEILQDMEARKAQQGRCGHKKCVGCSTGITRWRRALASTLGRRSATPLNSCIQVQKGIEFEEQRMGSPVRPNVITASQKIERRTSVLETAAECMAKTSGSDSDSFSSIDSTWI